MESFTKSSLKKSLQALMKHDKKLIDDLEPRLRVAKQRLRLSTNLYNTMIETESLGLRITKDEPKMTLLENDGVKRLSISKATQKMLKEIGKPLHAKQILAELPRYNSSASSVAAVWVALNRNTKLFKNIGKNTWASTSRRPT